MEHLGRNFMVGEKQFTNCRNVQGYRPLRK